MTHGAERLSLGEIEALARDTLTRAGCVSSAAAAVAWALRASERDGDRMAGLDRLPRLLEAVRMGAVSAHAQPKIRTGPGARLSVDADQGFADTAISAAFDALVDLAKSNGIAVANVVGTGDTPMPRPWLQRLAGHGVIGLALADPKGRGASFPTVAASRGEPMIEGLAEDMLTFLTGENKRAEVEDELPLVSCEGRMCILAITSPTGTVPDWADVSDRRREADTSGVDVSSELLQRILT